MTGIDFIASGNRQGTPLLLIHPMGADKSFWDPCRALWDDCYYSVACELSGAGRSPLPTTPLTFDGHAADIEEVRARLGLEQVVVAGCAVGAMIATRYAAAYPARVAGLALSNPGIFTREAARTALAKRAADVRRHGLEAVASAVIDATFLGQPDDEAKARFTRVFRAQDPEAYAMTIESMLDADTRPDLARIDCPMLLVAGTLDRLLPPDHAEEIKRMKPLADIFLVEGAAHFIPYQRPLDFVGLFDAFVRRRVANG